jgi:hypothetical protein
LKFGFRTFAFVRSLQLAFVEYNRDIWSFAFSWVVLNPALGKQKCPLGKYKCLLGKQKCPLGKYKCALGKQKCPLGKCKCPLGKQKCPLGKQKCPLGK